MSSTRDAGGDVESTTGTSSESRLGWLSVTPTKAVSAGSRGTWYLTYTVGSVGVDEDGAIKIAFPFVSDWGVTQFENEDKPDYASVTTSGRARVVAHYDPQAHVRPWQRAIVIRIRDGYLSPGDTVTVVLGDTSHGSPGATAQSFCTPSFEFVALVDAFGTGLFAEVPTVGRFEVIAANTVELVVIAPSDAVVGEAFSIFVKGQDKWGNPTEDVGRNISVQGEAIEVGPHETRDGMVHVQIVATARGLHRVQVDETVSGFSARSNPIRVNETRVSPRHYWGDLHGQSGETIGTNTVDEYMRFARDKACLDFVGHQANDFQITNEIWAAIKAAVLEFHEPGRFITFNGYEWSGLTGAGGDRNVMFRGDDAELRRSGHWQVEDLSDLATDCYPLPELYAAFRGRDDVMLIPHVGGRYANMAFHDPELEPLVEILSTHGEFEWLYGDALAAGCHVGVTCGSDDHTGRPGASYPGGAGLGLKGGLLCVLAPGLSRDELWASLKRQACYGTTGDRILLDVECNGSGIGGEVLCDQPPVFRVSVAGTADVERIELRLGTEVVDVFPPKQARWRDRRKLRIVWRGARHKGRGRAATWDGSVNVRGTNIETVSTYAFDTPREGVTFWDSHKVQWKSTTRGDADGLVLVLSDPMGDLEFRTDLVSFDIDLANLEDVHTIDAGGVGLSASVEWLPTTEGPDVTVELLGRAPSNDLAPYQVVVVQIDGGKAWSSPIWVSRPS